jgi:hypothetical protein
MERTPWRTNLRIEISQVFAGHWVQQISFLTAVFPSTTHLSKILGRHLNLSAVPQYTPSCWDPDLVLQVASNNPAPRAMPTTSHYTFQWLPTVRCGCVHIYSLIAHSNSSPTTELVFRLRRNLGTHVFPLGGSTTCSGNFRTVSWEDSASLKSQVEDCKMRREKALTFNVLS